MPGIFDSKYFNPEVFDNYVETVENPKLNKFLEANIFRTRQDLATKLDEQTGGNFIEVPMAGRIGGAPVNYDGNTDIDASSIGTYMQGMIVVGRAKAWVEKDFSADITSKNFMEEIASQVADYWKEVDQDTIIATLTGIFAGSNAFTQKHIYDITSETDPNVGSTTLNSAITNANGDMKEKYGLIITHSEVAKNLENLNVVENLKYTDANGMTRDVGLGTWNGKLLLIDDSVPVDKTYSSGGVYTVEVGGTIAEGDKLTVLDKTVTADSDDTATDLATAMVTALGTLDDYTVNRSTSTITFTEKSGHYGAGAPNASIQSTAGTVTVATTTEPVSTDTYNSFALGEGAFTYIDVGAEVPSETSRDPKSSGGKTYLYTRQRKVFAPFGFSFTKASMQTLSPTNEELANGANWEMVKDTAGNPIAHKLIPITKIVSLG
jgi:hypothetical protein